MRLREIDRERVRFNETQQGADYREWHRTSTEPALLSVHAAVGSIKCRPVTTIRKPGIGLFSGIFAILSLIPAIIVHIKRFHDRDKFGWWGLIVLIPIIGAIWLLIELGFLKGTLGPNRFGSPVID